MYITLFFAATDYLEVFYLCMAFPWQEDEEEDVGSYWMTLREGEDNLI